MSPAGHGGEGEEGSLRGFSLAGDPETHLSLAMTAAAAQLYVCLSKHHRVPTIAQTHR